MKIEYGVVYEGERIRGPDTYVELGGPKVEYKAELVQAKPEKDVKDGEVKIVGKDFKDLPEGGKLPFGILIEVSGKEIEEDLEPVIERRNHDFLNYVKGFMHLNQRYHIWCRISKDLVKSGASFTDVGKALIDLFKMEMPFIEKMQITFITDEKEVEEFYKKALDVYKARDERIRGMKDEEADDFYGCILCQSFAPNHVCMVSPQRPSLCGALSWLDCRAAAKVEPDGPIFAVPKGEVIDAEKGEFEGINESVIERSNSKNERFYLYSMWEYPHTSCCTPETEVITGNGKVIKVGELVDSKLEDINDINGKILSLKEGRALQQEFFLVHKHDAPSTLVKLTTKTGLTIELTPDHKVPVDTRKGLSWIEAESVKKGDRILALKKLDITAKEQYIIDFLQDDVRVQSKDLGEVKAKLVKKYGSLRKACKALKLKIHQLSSSIQIKEVKRIAHALNISWEKLRRDIKSFSIRSPIVEVSNPAISGDLMYLMGLIASDGCIVKRGVNEHVVTFVNTDKKLINKYCITYGKVFPGKRADVTEKTASKTKINGRVISPRKTCYACSSNNPLFGLLLESLGVKAGLKGEWNLHQMLRFPENLIASFLRGYFDGDGSVQLRSHKHWNDKWKTGELYLAIDEKRAAHHLQLLLKRLDIVSRVREDKSVYRVEVTGSENLIKFAESVGAQHSEKALVLNEVREYYMNASGSKNTAYDVLPYAAGSAIAGVVKNHGIPLSETTVYYYKTGRSRPHKSNVRPMLARNSGYVSEELTNLLNTDYFLDEIKSTEFIDSPNKHVYNITVADTHCFFANQLLIKNCGCFEAIAFFIPEVNGVGIVDRGFKDETINGLKFSTMAGQTGAGEQTEGFLGFGLQWLHSEKFLSADGGWKKIVWMPAALKEKFAESIPEDLIDKIATEKDVEDINALKDHLEGKGHPVLSGEAGAGEFEVTEELKEKLVAHIEEKDGEIYPDDASAALGVTEDQLMKVIEALQEEGVLE